MKQFSILFSIMFIFLLGKGQIPDSNSTSQLFKGTLLTIDSLMVEDFYFMKFSVLTIRYKGEIIVYTPKIKNLHDSLKYKKISIGQAYLLQLTPITNTNVIIKDLSFQLPASSNILVDGKLLFPEGYPIYLSKNLAGLYIFIEKD